MRGCKKRFSVSTLTEQKIALLVRDMNGAPVDVSGLNVSFDFFTVRGNEFSVAVENGLCSRAVIENGLLVIQPPAPFEPGVLKVSYKLKADNGNTVYNMAETNIDVLPSTACIGDMQSCVYADLYIEEICMDASYNPDGGSAPRDVLNTLLAGFKADKGGTISTSSTLLEALEKLAFNIDNGRMRLFASGNSLFILGVGDISISANTVGVRIDIYGDGDDESAEQLGKTTGVRVGTGTFSLLTETEENIISASEKWRRLDFETGGDVMNTEIGPFSVEEIVPVTVESVLRDVLSMLINVVDNGKIRFVRTAVNEIVILLKGDLNIIPPSTYGIKINSASRKIYFGNGDISLFDMTSSDIASESSSWTEMSGEKTSVSESWTEPLSIGPGEVLSLAESDNVGSAVQIKEADAGVYESFMFVPSLSGISFDVPDGYDMFLGTLGQAGTGNMTEYRIRWVIGENNKRVFITRILY